MPNKELKVVFFGTSEFAEVVLSKLIEANLNILAVVTQADKPVGRKKVMTPPLVKVLAEKNKISVYQGEYKDIPLKEADIFIIADYGEIISKKILEIPKYGALNIHPSLLPEYRGPSPIQYTLLNGDKETGVTIIKMDEKMDHGDIVDIKKYEINRDETYIDLIEQLAELGAKTLIRLLPKYISKKIKLNEQDHNKATYTKKIEKKNGEIDWNKPADEIYNQWRAYIKWPGIFSQNIKFNEIEIYRERIENDNTKLGELFKENKKLLVKCQKDSYLEIFKLQPQGKKEMDSKSYINGYLK